jgi:hypothetical protein
MELKVVQKKYPEFVYKNFGYKLENGNLAASFEFEIAPDIKFRPQIVIKNVSRRQDSKIGEAGIKNLIFHLGMAEIPTYWKATCSPKIIIEAGFLDKTQTQFWQNLIANGMGQFFYENRLAFIKPFFDVRCTKPKKIPLILDKFQSRYLVPLGGGKDSLVTLELLRGANKKTANFVLNPNPPVLKLLAVAGGRNHIVERYIDSKLIDLNRQGFFNGHTPFSSLLSFISVAVAALFDRKYIAISQERSSNEGNVRYLGKMINHQYSKTWEFENKFRRYSKKYLAKNIEYFSFLRPLQELQITKIFSRYQKYFPYFVSWNKPFTLVSRAAGQSGWCGKCPKCLSMFAMLYPFIGKVAAGKIFGKDLFNNGDLLSVMRDLLGQGICKPFECVGTFKETRSALYLSLERARKENKNLPMLLEIFQSEYLPKYPTIKKNTQKILTAWEDHNNLPQSQSVWLKNAAFDNAQ